jgi:N-acetylated-alpha-linked acidic dipeptidase
MLSRTIGASRSDAAGLSTMRRHLDAPTALFVAATALLARAATAQEITPGAPPPARALALELTATPRLAGTVGSITGAQIVAKHLEAAGWRVEIDEREVLLSLPRSLGFAVYGSGDAREAVIERRERFDAGAIPPGDVPKYSAWSASGRVRAKVVDVGFGLRADYERLAAAGIDVRGCIALARYGKAYRGVKAEMAEVYGCAGVLLFTEAASDGGEKGEVWPKGPWKPDWEAQRGSILPVQNAPGDPTTPGFASPRPGEEVERLARGEVDARLPKIPCLPIGVRDARAIQAWLAQDADGKPLGPGPVEVELDLDVPRDLRAVRNVVATLDGTGERLVIAGSHRDAWVRGANDSGSGCVALLRAAQRLGERAKQGWKPEHDIALAFWDAEEFGLIGSTEWGEANAGMLRERCLAYVNADACVSGTQFGASGAPGMLGVIRRVAERVRTADGSKSLWEDWCSRVEGGEPRLGLPGAGSDHTVFIHHLCIPVLEIGFGGNDAGGYHTTFDDFALVDRYLDPGWIGHELCGETLAELLAEMASAPGAGFDFSEAALAFSEHALKASPWLGEERATELAMSFQALATTAATDDGQKKRLGADFYLAFRADQGLPNRPWFTNALWAPALDNGYGSETFPSLRAAAASKSRTFEDGLTFLITSIEGLRAPDDDRRDRRAEIEQRLRRLGYFESN